jgi:hypothetical protein
MHGLLKKLPIAILCAAILVGGATLAIAAKGGDTKGNAATTQYSGGTGCSHGYWKTHPKAWTGTTYSLTDIFDTVFGVTHFGTLTLDQALDLKGGGYNALAREATAALLNSKTSTIGFTYTQAQVIQLVQEGFAASDPEPIKDALESANTSGCKLS